MTRNLDQPNQPNVPPQERLQPNENVHPPLRTIRRPRPKVQEQPLVQSPVPEKNANKKPNEAKPEP